MTARIRIDVLLVQRGIFDSRARAQAAIKAGLVKIGDRPVRSASEMADPLAQITATPAHPYVSRGGVKLAAALDHFALSPAGRVCMDVGASTGGFTDVLLERGAACVYAIDTGRDQLHPAMRAEPRVVVMEGTDVRKISPGALDPAPELAVIDVSFISLRLVLPPVAALLPARSEIVALIKPQFEVGRGAIGKGGIVRDEAARAAAIDTIRSCLSALAYQELGLIDSPIAGGDGNRELLIAARRHV